MFRLLRLTAFALLGYALYEFFRGLTTDIEAGPAEQGGGRRAGQSGLRSESQGRGQRSRSQDGQPVTGPGRGMPVQTQDANGGAVPHVVGRGIVHR